VICYYLLFKEAGANDTNIRYSLSIYFPFQETPTTIYIFAHPVRTWLNNAAQHSSGLYRWPS
jgi:hypothetical protein